MIKPTSSPFTTRQLRTPQLMLLVLLSTIPGILVQSHFFGWGNLIQIILAAGSAWAFEYLVLRLRNRPALRILKDNSAVLTGVLLGIALPPLLPFWVTLLASFFAIVVVKHLYGGLGHNLFNPAMAAYVLLLIAFPVLMTSWQPVMSQAQHPMGLLDTLTLILTGYSSDGYSLDQARQGLDGLTAATPLDLLKTDLRKGLTTAQSMAKPTFGLFAGAGWEWINLAFLVGGLYLAKRRLIALAIPAGFLGALLLCSALGYLLNPQEMASPHFHLFSGATMLGAFFIATDPVSASTTPKGRWLFGAMIGLLVYAIRSWGGYPDAVAFSVLLANMCVPLIDYYTQPRSYGHSRGNS